MFTLGSTGRYERYASWRRLIILLAVFALSLSLATRYTRTEFVVAGSSTSLSDLSSGAKTQHLLADGLEWTAPVTIFIVLVVPHYTARLIPLALPVTELYAENWLYNRPPPSC